MATRSERGAATRERLLEAATVLTGEIGWSAVTTRLVAERAGLAPGLVHYHFASVDDLLRKAALRTLEALLSEPTHQLLAAERPADGLRQLADQFATLEPDDVGFALMAELMLATVRERSIQPDVAAMLAEYRNLVATWLAGHDIAGAENLAALVVAALDGALLHRLVDPGIDLHALIEPLAQLLEQRTEGMA